MKLVRELSKPIGSDTGLKDIAAMISSGALPPLSRPAGHVTKVDTSAKYVEHLLSYIDRSKLRKLKVVVDAGNGGAGLAVDKLAPHLPFEFIKVRHNPDGRFPQGIPNPMLEENRGPTLQALKASGADVAIAWDGDYDRCFFFDEQGTFIEGYYIVGLLAEQFLKRFPGGKIVYDPRLTWNTVEMVKKAGGVPVMSKSGHAFIKQKMREVDGVYGGEMSAAGHLRKRQVAVATRRRANEGVSCERGDQPQTARCEEGVGSGAGTLRKGRCAHRSHGRVIGRLRRLALQHSSVQYGAARAAECRIARRHAANAGEDGGVVSVSRYPRRQKTWRSLKRGG
jgi:hypothetical protein